MSPARIGRRVIRLATTASTMDDAAALADAGEPEGTVVVANTQTAGRGRAGRSWQAAAGTSVLCSVLLRPAVPPDRLGVLPLLVGVAVAETLEVVAAVSCQLKWPNDVWIEGLKAAGILVAARAGTATVAHAIVGIGINVNVSPTELPQGGTSILAATGRIHDLEAVLATLLERLDAGYGAFLDAKGRPNLGGWRTRAALMGETVDLRVGGQTRRGTLRGIADDGALLLERTDGAIERVISGDLVRGPVAAVIVSPRA